MRSLISGIRSWLAPVVAAPLIVVALLTGLTTGAYAIESEVSVLELRVKAAFLYKFAGYVEWPAQMFAHPDEPVVIGVVDANTLANELEQVVVGRQIGDRPITIRRLSQIDQTKGLHILFVGGGVGRAQTFDLLTRTHGEPVLTVTEAEHAWHFGSVINFVIDNDKVRFQISVAAASGNGLRLGSQLLAVAREVRMEPR